MRGDLYIGTGTALWDWQNGIPSTLASDAVEGVNATGSVRSTTGVTLDVMPAADVVMVKLLPDGARAQFNINTCIRLGVKSTYDTIEIVSSPNYHNYTIAGSEAKSDDMLYTPTGEDVARGYVDVIAFGKTYIFSISVYSWLDVWENWGVGLEGDEAYEALMTFRPNKEPIVNKNVTAKGAYYVTGAGLVDERTVNVPFHIVAFDKADFLMKRAGFYNAIQGGLIRFKIANPVEAEYQFYYMSCSQYTQFFSGMAKFMLTLYETNGCHDGDDATVSPEPWAGDMQEYIAKVLESYGATIASEEDVRNIVHSNS